MQKELEVTAISAEDAESELKQVHIVSFSSSCGIDAETICSQVFRHGDRTPHYPYPNDPHKNHDYAPYGFGQLTKVHKFDICELWK